MQTDWLQMLYKYWDEKDTPDLDDFYFWTDWLFQYYNKLPLGDNIESAYLKWNSEQHRLTPKYKILRSLAPHVKKYFTS